jgi:hypothetical protein
MGFGNRFSGLSHSGPFHAVPYALVQCYASEPIQNGEHESMTVVFFNPENLYIHLQECQCLTRSRFSDELTSFLAPG